MKTLLQEMLGYVSVSTCRQLAILEYFSDEDERALGPCGLCDRCVAPVPQPHRRFSTMTCFCEGHLGDRVLVHGSVRRESNRRDSSWSRSKGLLAYGAEDCPTYGTCRARSKLAMTGLVKDLIDSAYLHVEALSIHS